jgi:RNA polymerase primary sigma factor
MIVERIVKMTLKINSLELYFDAIKKIKTILPEDVEQLWKRVKIDKEAFDKLVEQNYKLVIPVARRFMKQGLDLMDLIEEGNVGLMKAVEKFDYSRNIAFSTYATFWIEQYIRRALENQMKTIKIPAHIWNLLNLWMKTKAALREKFRREPTDTEIAKKLHMKQKQVNALMRASSVFNGVVSLDSTIQEDSELHFKDTIADVKDKSPESVTEVIRTRADIGLALNELSDREREIIRMRFGIGGIAPMSLDAVGRLLNISSERVRQLELKSFKRLKTILAKYNFIDQKEMEKIQLDSRSGKDRRKKETQPSIFADRRYNIERRTKWM